jgi:Holliday junction resolvase RusA-like endonuclease
VTVITLPMPPSTNALFFNRKGGRTRTPEYEAWLEHAGHVLNRQSVKPVEGRVDVQIDLDDSRRGDADNRIKPVLDFLVKRGVLKGDSKKFVRRVSAGWEAVTGCRVSISPA